METVSESFPEIWKEIETKSILKSEIDSYSLKVLLKIIEEVRQGKRDELDIGDIFGLFIQHAGGKGYKLKPEIEDFFFKLGSYRDDPFDTGEIDPKDTPDEVENELKRISKKLKISLN